MPYSGYNSEQRKNPYKSDRVKGEKGYNSGKADEYETDDRESIPFVERERPEVREIIREVVRTKRQGMPRFDEEEDKPLNLITPEVLGTMFDRVKFVEERITDMKDAMKQRTELHNYIIEEIEVDIIEKEKMIQGLADPDERRNITLDISVLRRDKRREYIQYWRDMLELRNEIKDLLEQFEIEKKISEIFSDLKDVEPDSESSKKNDLKDVEPDSESSKKDKEA